ncbi:MarR family winged helix-turn-helix transcriptional regulator [Pedobacter sp. UBA5917]|uniref:MarR family winged helix-turn-helix transcriptional regulator n=1 Tax=Pedobacter sp. UBA5917 TaxID=1947061 RepID=UPI0025F3852D|nr:MarR family winged helix-turn-helix transcriptional regulator [Pedobacter sp. UBA5917]
MQKNEETIQTIRAFNRFYTSLIGLLDGNLLYNGYSLAEARILYEIHIGKPANAANIITALDMDKGYLSRILKKLQKDGLVGKAQSKSDARVSLLHLTDKGLKIFHELNQESNEQIGLLINPLPNKSQNELVTHMKAIMNILGTGKNN